MKSKNLNLKTKNNNLKLKSFKILAVTFSFSLLVFSFPVRAQQISLSISPPLLEVMIQPGKTITQSYKIGNNSNTDLYVRAIVVPFEPADTQGKVGIRYQVSGIRYFTLTNSDIQLGQTFRLPANSQKQLVLKIAVPKDELEADQYFTFLVEQSPEIEFLGPQGGQNLIKIGSNILLTVSRLGNPKKQGVIAKFLPYPKIADLFDKVKFKVLIQNTGDAYFKPIGQIDIYNQITKKKMTGLKLRPDNILVDSAREIMVPAFSSWLPGRYKAVLSFTPDGKSGAKTASLQETASAIFWLLPIKSGLAILTLLIIIWQIYKIKLDKLDKTS